MDSQSIDTISVDQNSAAQNEAIQKHKLILQLKLGYILHKYHLSQQVNGAVDSTMAFMDFVNHYAEKYADEYETTKESIAEVCNNVCKGVCLTKKYSISQLREKPEFLEKCPFDLNVLHAILHDGYPVDSYVYNMFKEITGHELLPTYSSTGK